MLEVEEAFKVFMYSKMYFTVIVQRIIVLTSNSLGTM